MTRTLAFALSGLLAFAGFAPAQSDTGPKNYQQLVNSRYVPDSQSRADRAGSLSRRHVPQASLAPSARPDPEFAPRAYIERLFVDTMGRQPTDLETRYWLRRLSYQPREDVALEIMQRRPTRWPGYYDPRYGLDYDPGPGSSFFPDPASLNFRDPSGPYFKSPYYSNYQYRRPLRAFPLGSRKFRLAGSGKKLEPGPGS
jgi:hypothetical protein